VAKVDRLTRSVAFLSRHLMHARRGQCVIQCGAMRVSRLLEAARSPFGDILDDWGPETLSPDQAGT
jgi:hypothetical protein